MSVTNSFYGGDWCKTDWCSTNWCSFYTITSMNSQIIFLANGISNTRMQTNWVFYNTSNLRILWEIASDGMTSSNFIASSNAAADKNILNVKTDIIEQYWQSTSSNNQYIQWDSGTGKAIYIDTLAILGHNFTSTCVITLQGYGVSTDVAPVNWGTIPIYATIMMGSNPNDDRVIWCSPTVPLTSYRHWRLNISDSNNSNNYIRIGRFIAGQSFIMNGENILDTLKSGKQNFKEEIKLNGFSSIFNNRSLKRNLTIDFSDLNIQNNSNKQFLTKYIDYNRDVFKALIIPDPTQPYKYTVYAKLSSMPTENVSFVDSLNEYTAFNLSYDEAK